EKLMPMRFLRPTVLWMCCCMSLVTQAQQAASAEELMAVARDLKSLRSYGYDYRITMTAPDGQQEELSGKTFWDATSGIMYNTNAATTVLLTPKWYYRAEHKDRELTLIDLDKHYNDENKQR